MTPQLHNSLLRMIGSWEQIYSQHMSLRSPNSSGECRGTPPWADYEGSSADSFSLNAISGEWFCHSSRRHGDYVQFRRWLDGHLNQHGELVPVSYAHAERTIASELGLVSEVDPAWIQNCHAALVGPEGLALRENLMRVKYWPIEILHHLVIGYDIESDTYVIPIYDEHRAPINCRLYRPGASDVKMRWLHQHYGGSILYPYLGWHEDVLYIVEGETDAISLRALGFPAVSGTHGGNNPVPDGNWYANRTIYVLTDNDAVGEEAANTICRVVTRTARAVYRCSLPEWPGKRTKSDISDYILHLHQQGHDYPTMQRMLLDHVFNLAVQVNRTRFEHGDPDVLPFREVFDGSNIRRRMAFRARVLAVSPTRYLLPQRYRLICPVPGSQRICQTCPIANNAVHEVQGIFESGDYDGVRMIKEPRSAILNMMKARVGVPTTCAMPDYTVDDAESIDSLLLCESAEELGASEDVVNNPRDAMVVSRPDTPLIANRTYEFEGTILDTPNKLQAILWVDHSTPVGMSHDNFVVDDASIQMLSQFAPPPGVDVFDHLKHVSMDLMYNVTQIYDRLDLHMVYRTVWHSQIAFQFGKQYVDRGWIELIVIGDTRCGKSSTFRRMRDWFGVGQLIDCKNQSVPGILGTVVQRDQSGWYVTPGTLPQNDRGIVCFDEFTSLKGENLVEALSSTRSEGVVRISKAATAEFSARVRSIWLANPGVGLLMQHMSETGVESITRIIHQPEDIARFDLGMAVTQHDIPAGALHREYPIERPRWGIEATRKLISWTYSRRPEQVVFHPDAITYTHQWSEYMCAVYDPTIPLVEPADQRNRIAKIAVSVAAQCFSTDDTHQTIQVRPEHVQAAVRLMQMCYDKASMGYNTFSAHNQRGMTLEHPETIQALFDAHGRSGQVLARELLRLDEFSARSFAMLTTISPMQSQSLLATLNEHKCLRLSARGRRDAYEKTVAFITWLKAYTNGDVVSS